MFIGVYNLSVLLTYLGVCFSVFGMYLAITDNIPAAIMCLIMAGVCDMFDGYVARKCKRTDDEKKFGIQIDSLADTVSFGVFPIILGLSMKFTNVLCIIIYILYGLAAVIRLAYFNVLAEEKVHIFNFGKKNKKVTYYYGLPVTTIAIILPFVYNFNIFFNENLFKTIYPVSMLLTAVLFVLNFKLKKPTGIWYAFCTILAIVEIVIVATVLN